MCHTALDPSPHAFLHLQPLPMSLWSCLFSCPPFSSLLHQLAVFYILKCLITGYQHALSTNCGMAMPDRREGRGEGWKGGKGRGWPMSHLPSLHLAMTATRGRCHRNHNLKKGGITFNIRERWSADRREEIETMAEKQKNNMTYGIWNNRINGEK